MIEPITINVGGIALVMSRTHALSVMSQLADAGIGTESAQPEWPLILRDDDPMWSLHSGGDRHTGPDWTEHDQRIAQTQDRLPPLTAVFHDTLVDHPGWVLSVEDLADFTQGRLANSRVIAGALSGYGKWCERLNRRFPFYWWERANGESTQYAMPPKVSRLFREAR